MVMDGPDVIRWLIQLGMQFDLEDDRPIGGNLLRKKPGGASAARILSYRDYTGLEMMRVLREAVDLDAGVAVWNRCPVVELLSDERGRCAGAVIYNLEWRSFVLVRARAVILATGGAGRLHLNRFPTSNHYGATADGLVLAYRIGARLRELDSFQYHPTGVAYPPHLAGGLISEAARSAGAKLINGEGERFVDELQPRDVVASAILRECAEGRGIERDGQLGVFLDTPTLEKEQPGHSREAPGDAAPSRAQVRSGRRRRSRFSSIRRCTTRTAASRSTRTAPLALPGCIASASWPVASTAATA